MIDPVLVTGLLGIVLGLLLYVWKEHEEALHLRMVSEYLRGDEEEEEHAPDPEESGAVIERIRMVLGAGKLLRLLAWLLMLPGAVLVAGRLHGKLATPGPLGVWIPLLVDVTLAVVLVTVIVALYSFFQKRARESFNIEAHDLPEWMCDRERAAPLLFAVGWHIWEHLLGALDVVLGRLGAERPQAQLYEVDQRVRLRIAPRNGRPPQAGGEKSDTERTEEQMIRAIHRLDNTVVREVMRPINQVTAIRLKDYNPRRLLELCRRTGYTRIPVYEDQITNLIGFINVYDLLEEGELPESLAPMVTRALFVPEVARIDSILQEMIRAKQQVAIVFDEFGGTSGWLSREDILEEIVGEVADEYERVHLMIMESKGGYLVDPSVDLDDLREQIGLELPKRYCDTIAGYVYYRLGRVPKRGETIEEKGWKIRVSAIENHRIRRLRLIPANPPERPSS